MVIVLAISVSLSRQSNQFDPFVCRPVQIIIVVLYSILLCCIVLCIVIYCISWAAIIEISETVTLPQPSCHWEKNVFIEL